MSKQVLVIDDNHKIRELFASYMALKGLQVKTLGNGLNIIEELSSNDYDIILLDLAMPEVSGFEVLDIMEKNNVSRENVVVLTAADVSDEERAKLKSYKIKAFLEKPTELPTLMSLIC